MELVGATVHYNTALLGQSEKNVQITVNIFETVSERTNLKVRSGKSKVVVFEKGPEYVCRTALQDQGLEVVEHFQCLGSTTDREGGVSDEMKGRQVVGGSE